MLPSNDLSALVSSRICHDLISPIGAIGNGLELLLMSHQLQDFGPEMDLIQQSLDKAKAQISLYRIAFGRTARDMIASGTEISAALGTCYAEGRIRLRCDLPSDLPRAEAKLALVVLMCLEKSIPRGGELRLGFDGKTWHLQAHGDLVPVNLTPSPMDPITDPSVIQFALLPEATAAAQRQLVVTQSDDQLHVRF